MFGAEAAGCNATISAISGGNGKKGLVFGVGGGEGWLTQELGQ